MSVQHDLRLDFDESSDEFLRGFEIGVVAMRLGQQLDALTVTTRESNRRNIEILAEEYAYDVEFKDGHPGWIHALLVHRRLRRAKLYLVE